MHHPVPGFDNNIINPAINLEKMRIIRLIAVTADAKFEAIFLPFHTLSAELQVVRVQIETDNRIGTARLQFAVTVQVQVWLDKLRNRRSFGLTDVILQFATAPNIMVARSAFTPPRSHHSPSLMLATLASQLYTPVLARLHLVPDGQIIARY